MIRTSDRALIIMAKQPEAGSTKTRLAEATGPEGAAELYECFLADTVDLARSADDADPVIAYHPPGALAYFKRLAPDAELVAQHGSQLGDRLDHVLAYCLDEGYQQVAAIGSDSPTLPLAMIDQAFAVLAKPDTDLVLGPTADGGYYLIGVKERPGRLVTDVVMSTPTVLSDTLALAAEDGLTVQLLDPWHDVDEPSDLARLRREVTATTSGAQYTRALLDQWHHGPPTSDHRTLTPIDGRPARVAAVIPALDEEATIAEVVKRVRAQSHIQWVIVSDNGSADRTVQEAAQAGLSS